LNGLAKSCHLIDTLTVFYLRISIACLVFAGAVVACKAPDPVAGSAPAKSVAPPKPVPKTSHTLVGNWLKEKSKDYIEGVYFYPNGKFARWGREPEGGWSTPGDYSLKGNKIHFKCIAPSLDNFGKDDDAIEGEAELVWITDDKIEFRGHGRKLALTRLPKEETSAKS